MIDLKSARRHAYRSGRQISLMAANESDNGEARLTVQEAWIVFLAQFNSYEGSSSYEDYLYTAFQAGLSGDEQTDDANNFLLHTNEVC